MNVFSEEAIAQLAEEYETILPKRDQQIIAFFSHEFADERASEYAHHGFMRRLKMLSHCIDRIFHLLPPEMQVIPDSEDIADAQMALHAFIINVYGCVDNLAWVLVHERQIRKEDGTPIPNSWVGLGRDNAHVRNTLSENFQNYLVSIDGWFDNLENYRHSLAHRIPLYIPPYIVLEGDVAEYNDLENRKHEASRRHEHEEWERLDSEQVALGFFHPSMGHSFHEEHGRVLFHPQILADFNTIDDLASKVLIELQA